MLSAVLRSMGKPADSLEELEALEKIDPEYWPMQINFAHTYKELGRPKMRWRLWINFSKRKKMSLMQRIYAA